MIRVCLVMMMVLGLSSRSRAEELTQASAEALARKRWFEFELKPVKTRFHGDWVAFVKSYEKEEPKSAAGECQGGKGPPHTSAQARACRAVQLEFVEVAQTRKKEIHELAKRVLSALQRGDIEPLVDDCAMYDATAKNRRELTRAYLVEHQAELSEIAKLANLDDARFDADLQFNSPSPATGMTGQAAIAFGPKAERPKEGNLTLPTRHQLELWWSGEVMPEANGPVHPSPTGKKPRSRWRFYQLVKPYSQREGGLL